MSLWAVVVMTIVVGVGAGLLVCLLDHCWRKQRQRLARRAVTGPAYIADVGTAPATGGGRVAAIDLSGGLPDYGSIERCPKCRADAVTSEYCMRPVCWQRDYYALHHHRTCSRCGYGWLEKPLDWQPH